MPAETDRRPGPRRSRGLLAPVVTYSILGLAQRGVWLILLPVYLTVLPSDQFGVLLILTFMATIFAVPANLRLDAALRTFYFDYVDGDPARDNYLLQVMSLSLISALLSYAVILAVGNAAFELLFEHEQLTFFPLGPLAVATACINACLAPYFVYLRNATRLRELVWLQSSLLVGSVALQVIFLIVLDLGIRGALLGAFVPSLVALTFVVVTRTGFAPHRLSRESLLPSLRYSLPLIAFAFLYLLEARLDTIVLEHHVSLRTIGGYAVLVSLFGLLAFALNALDNALRPLLYPAIGRNDERTPGELRQFKAIYAAGGLVTLSSAVLLGSLSGMVTDDPDYLAIRDWLVPAATAFAPMILTRYYALFFDYHKRSIELTFWLVIRTGIMLALLLLLVPPYGVQGALFAVFLSQLANALAFSISARRKFGLDVPVRGAVLQIAAFLLIIWGLFYLSAGDTMIIFGGLQFIAVIGLVVAAGWAAMRRESSGDI